ncbi:DUF4350 domain-containing protein [Flavobacterium sp. HSC-61S13]|uniref:DUF4350 domain-containing protein n=1 Tax=Flavobacterium sp. HSC-61S13 TaxID=2910963 RepID=UPI00209D3111|nr:DUF4350 domain-containing protein [Flavobacterium sp. HSC-61S13]MCP1997234.1 hypothetical protein [Flavobacterium sp. HSC-61S13]
MNSTIKKYLFFLGFAILLIIFIDYNKPKPIDWSSSFSIEDKIPFGLYILNQEMDSLVKERKLERFNRPIYDFINDSLLQDSTGIKTLLLIENQSSINYPDTEKVLEFVAKGNTLFAVADFFPQSFTDTLKLNEFTYSDADKTVVWTTNQSLSRQQFNLDKAYSYNYFSAFDTLKTTVLGYQTTSNTPKVTNFIKIPFGRGFVFLNTQPKAFTNYSLLESNNHLYVENVLSYLPNQPVYWKVLTNTNDLDEAVSSSPLRFVLQNPALKWAWYFILLGILIVAVFTAKRRQRTIPIIKPLPNTSVEFAKTISSLYSQSANYSDLMDKIIVYSLSKIRRIYMIDTSKLDDHFVQSLHKMTLRDQYKIKKWIDFIEVHRANPHAATQESVIAFNTLTEEILN